MKRAIMMLLAIIGTSAWAMAQEGPVVAVQGPGPGAAMSYSLRSTPVQGAPYSATITDESVQTLADGTHIVQNFTGTMARDSQGRTRHDASLPPIGNLSAENAPHIVFIQDPVAQVSYTLNLTDKTAMKMPMPPIPPGARGDVAFGGAIAGSGSGPVTIAGPMPLPPPPAGGGDAVYVQSGNVASISTGGPPAGLFIQKSIQIGDSGEAKTEELGNQIIEGLVVSGTRVTRTIPAGQIGNDKPISIVTEVWTSPDLKTIVSSKRSDPRMGEQTFQLTNITRGEPDASLFTVPPDFKVLEGPQKIVYGVNK